MFSIFETQVYPQLGSIVMYAFYFGLGAHSCRYVSRVFDLLREQSHGIEN